MQIRTIQNKIYQVRGERIMLDFDLAEMYEAETRVLKQAVRRNLDRFPHDFMFQLSKEEWQQLITICDNLPENIKFSPITPFAFTEQGVAMLSSVFNSQFKDINQTLNYLLNKDQQQTTQANRKQIGFKTKDKE